MTSLPHWPITAHQYKAKLLPQYHSRKPSLQRKSIFRPLLWQQPGPGRDSEKQAANFQASETWFSRKVYQNHAWMGTSLPKICIMSAHNISSNFWVVYHESNQIITLIRIKTLFVCSIFQCLKILEPTLWQTLVRISKVFSCWEHFFSCKRCDCEFLSEKRRQDIFKMPCLTTCCCGFSVKAGTRAIAILSVVR